MPKFPSAVATPLLRYFDMLNLQNELACLPLIRKLEREIFDSPVWRRDAHLALLDSRVPQALALLASSKTKQLCLKRLHLIFADPIDFSAGGMQRRAAINRARQPIVRVLERVAPYGLFDMEVNTNGNGHMTATLLLERVFEEFVPYLRSCIVTSDKEYIDVVQRYAAFLGVWRLIVYIINVDKIGQGRWPKRKDRSRARTALRNTDSARIMIPVAVSERAVTLGALVEMFRDPAAKMGDMSKKESRLDYENSRYSTWSRLETLQSYGLVHLVTLEKSGSDGQRGKYRIQATEELNRAMREFSNEIVAFENRSLDELFGDDRQ